MSKIDELKLYINHFKNDKNDEFKKLVLKNNYEFYEKIFNDPDRILKDTELIEDKIKLYLDDDQLVHNDIKNKINTKLTEVINESYIEKLLLFIFENYSWPSILEEEDDDISSQDILIYSGENNFEFDDYRDNQKEALKIHQEQGWITGIHCQSTGTGKSLIFIRLCMMFYEDHNTEGYIFITTERINILLDLFYTKIGNQWRINEANKIKWKENGIINLDYFEIINFVTEKPKCWYSLIDKPSDKQKIILINRAFLTRNNNYKKLSKAPGLIIHDECHSCVNKSTYDCFDFLKKKFKNVPIIGFSATPLRIGKTNGDHNESRLVNIFCDKNNDKKLELLTNYNIIYSIERGWILPPTFYWFSYENENKDKLTDKELDIIMKSMNERAISMPNRKGVAWCGRISTAKKWFKKFNENKHKYSNLKDIECYIDHSKSNDCDDGYRKNVSYTAFRRKSKDAIIFCANKHREGSDIPYLDFCIFLDKVKNRSSNTFIQCIGRVLRKSEGKTEGIIIDGYFQSEGRLEAKHISDKIIGYYLYLENIATDEITAQEKNAKYLALINSTIFDVEKNQIEININNIPIKVNLNCLKFDFINETFKEVLCNKMKLGKDKLWKEKCKFIKEKLGFDNPRLNFFEEYSKIDLSKYELPDIEVPEWKEIVAKKSWYEWLDLEPDFYDTPNAAKTILEENKNIDCKLMNEEYYKKCCELDLKLPPYPYMWWKEKFTGYDMFHPREISFF